MRQNQDCNIKSVNETQRPRRAYLFARYSSSEQGQGDSFQRQLEAAENWCRVNDATLCDVELADGVSAWKGKQRAQGSKLDQLRERIQPGEYLLFDKQDRMSRENWLAACNFLENVTAKGAVAVTIDNGNVINHERLLKDPGCFLTAVLAGHLANAENEKRSLNIRSSWKHRKEAVLRGERPINQNLPGWLVWKADKTRPNGGDVVIDEAKAAVVRRMFALYLEHGRLSEVCRVLNTEGAVRVSRRSCQSRTSDSQCQGYGHDYVFRCLTNPAVIGTCLGKPKLYPSIVVEQDFYRVTERLKQGRHNTVSHKAPADNLFAGILTCSSCGGPLHRHSQKRNGRTYPYMLCGRTLRGVGTCGLSGIRYDALERAVLNVLNDSGLIQRALATQPQQEPSTLDVLKGKLAVTQNAANRLFASIEGDDHPARRVMERLKELEAEEDALAVQLAEEEAKAKALRPALCVYREIQELREAKDPDVRLKLRTAMPGLVERIVVDLKEVGGAWRCEFKLRNSTQILLLEIVPGGWRLAGVGEV